MIKNIAYSFHEHVREYFFFNCLQKFNEIFTEICKYGVTTVIFTLFTCIFCFQWRTGTVLLLLLYCCNVNIWSMFNDMRLCKLKDFYFIFRTHLWVRHAWYFPYVCTFNRKLFFGAISCLWWPFIGIFTYVKNEDF